MILDELISLLGLDIAPGAEQTGKKYDNILKNITLTVAGVAAALGAAVTATAAFATSQARGITETGKFADSVQLSFERLQELDYVAGQLNVSSEQLRADLSGLNKSMSSNMPGEYNAGLYRLGISARDASGQVKKVDEVLLEVADRMRGMSARKKMQFADQLGLSEASIALIDKGRAGVAELTAQAHDLNIILDETARVRADKFNSTLAKAQAVTRGFAKALAVGLLPLLSEGLDVFTDWVQVNGEFLRSGLTQFIEGAAEGFGLFADAAGAAYDWVKDLLGGFNLLNEPLDATGAIAIAVAVGIGAAAAALLVAYAGVIAMTAAVAAAVVVFEDLYNALTGQPSLIGDWAKAFATAYPEITKGLATVWGWISKIATFIGGAFVEGVTRAFKLFATWIEAVFGGLGDLLTAINDLLAGKDPFEVLTTLFKSSLARMVQLAKDIFGVLFAPLPDDLQSALLVVMKLFSDATELIFKLFDSVFSGLPSLMLETARDIVSAIVEVLTGSNPFDVLVDLLSKVGDRLKQAVRNIMGDGLFGAIGTALNLIGVTGSSSATAGATALGGAPATLPAAMIAGSGGATSGGNTNTFYINGAGNPQAVADQVLSRGNMGAAVQATMPGNQGPVTR